jgi:ABC-type oligopeptide transport system ATPase subunit
MLSPILMGTAIQAVGIRPNDLAVVETISDEVVVMYLGRIVERGDRSAIFANPQHDYTRLLLSSVTGAKAL